MLMYKYFIFEIFLVVKQNNSSNEILFESMYFVYWKYTRSISTMNLNYYGKCIIFLVKMKMYSIRMYMKYSEEFYQNLELLRTE